MKVIKEAGKGGSEQRNWSDVPPSATYMKSG